MTELLLGLITALLGGIAFFVKRILDKTDNLEVSLKPIVPAIVEIQGKFAEAGHEILFPVTVAPGSPLRLTDYGKKLVHESGFDHILEACRDDLVEQVKFKKPTTNYDIQKVAIEVIRDLIDSDDQRVRPLKEYAFNNGLKIELLVPPAGILLRDEVMKELKL